MAMGSRMRILGMEECKFGNWDLGIGIYGGLLGLQIPNPNSQIPNCSTAFRLELLHKFRQGFDSRHWHGVIDAGADAADAAVPFEAVEAPVFARFGELFFESFGREAETRRSSASGRRLECVPCRSLRSRR